MVFAPASLATPLADAIAACGSELGLRVEGQRAVTSSSFTFEVEVFVPGFARETRALLADSLPADVRVEGFSESEESHQEARGPEPFAPLHSYRYCASGRIKGEFEAVVDVWKRAREREYVRLGPLTVDTKPPE
jgi:hypothetical protein